MSSASTAMDAIVAATKRAAPQNAEELKHSLDELPRRALQALSKSHGVPATLKREALVGKLVSVLSALLWPATETQERASGEEAATNEDVAMAEEDDTAAAMEEEKAMATEEEKVTAQAVVEEKTAAQVAKDETAAATLESTPEVTATTAADAKTTTKTTTSATKKTVTSAVVVGKKAVATTRRGKPASSSSPTKLKKATPVKATALTPSKTMAKIHAKQAAKQMTLQEHEQAKKQRAALLLSGNKSSAVKQARSKARDHNDTNVGESSITKTLSFGAATPAKKTTQIAAAGVAVTKGTNSEKKTKASINYKPYAGPLPVYEGDSLFSPKKITPRPAPMAVAVMKAARAAAPRTPKSTPAKKLARTTNGTLATNATPTKKSPARTATSTKKATPTKNTPIEKAKKATPTKKAAVNKSPSKVVVAVEGKENKPVVVNANATDKTAAPSAVSKKVASAMTPKPRSSVKAATTTTVSVEAKKQERRAKFAQDTKAKSLAARRDARGGARPKMTSSIIEVTKAPTTTTTSSE